MWEYKGITGNTDPPMTLGLHRGETCLVLGAGRCLWDDLDSIKDYPFDDVMAVNYSALFYPGRISHFASLEGRGIANLSMALHHRTFSPPTQQADKWKFPYKTHIHINDPAHHDGGLLWNMPDSIKQGTSGFFAMLVAVCLGFDKIILAGMPLDGNGRYFDPPNVDSGVMPYQSHTVATCWIDHQNNGKWAGNVRSCSGRTKEWLGGPTREWFER